MTIADQVKGAAAAVKDKVAGATGTSAQVSTRIVKLHAGFMQASCITEVT